MAAVLNPRTRRFKLTTDAERGHVHGLVRSGVAKIVEMDRTNDNQLMQSVAIISPSLSSQKKFKSYTAQFDDHTNYSQLNNDMTKSTRAYHELETYLQLDLSKCTYPDDENDIIHCCSGKNKNFCYPSCRN